MSTIHLGSDSEYVKITLNPPFTSEGWCHAHVEISASCFHGQIEPWVEAFDIESFSSQLAIVYDTLQGEAKLAPREEQLALCVQAGTGGHIQVKGIAWSKATYENRLEFTLELDQSFLPRTLTQLREVVSRSQASKK